VGGVCTGKVAEAEVMVAGGVNDILIANQVVTRDKISRLCALARQGDMKVCVDNPDNVRQISDVASEHGVTIGVLIEVDTSMGRAGARTREQAVELARLAQSLPGVAFRGVMSHQSLSGSPDRETRHIGMRQYIQTCLDVKDAIEAAGIPVEVVSSGETMSYDLAALMPGVTEVEGGSYALGCVAYDNMEEFRIAGKILATVVSTPSPGTAIGDVGSRAIGIALGQMPSVDAMPGVTVEALLEEHVVLRTDGGSRLEVGDKFMLLPWHQDSVPNRWDEYVAVRDGVVEEVWDIPGSRCYH
jgi:3-hydroxy-D-aspartate aldolase